MPRIIKGMSKEVRSVVSTKTAQPSEDFVGRSFRDMRIEGTVTEGEMGEQVRIAREESKREGAREAEKKLQVPLKTALENVESLLDEISRFRRELFKESETEIIDFVKVICKRLLVKELSMQPDQLKEVVSKALESVEKHRKIVLHVSAADHATFLKAKPDFLERYKGVEELEILVDPQLERGNAILTTKTMELDIKLEAMVDHLINHLSSFRAPAQEVNDEEDRT